MSIFIKQYPVHHRYKIKYNYLKPVYIPDAACIRQYIYIYIQIIDTDHIFSI